MHIRPILVALRKHKLATFLIAMEIALACAVLCNAVFIIANRLSAMNIVTGVDEASLGEIVVTGFEPKEASDLNARMMAGLAAIPGVESVHAVSSVPFGPQAGVAGVTLDHKHYGTVIDYYVGDSGTIKALGLELVAGAMPDADDYQAIPDKAWLPPSARVLVTRALADRKTIHHNLNGMLLLLIQFDLIAQIVDLAINAHAHIARTAHLLKDVLIFALAPLHQWRQQHNF